MSAARRSGRRSGTPDTRSAILTAARELFAHNGFDTTSVRAVAARAGVDAALVHHYFGTKRDLLRAAIEMPVNPDQVLGPVMAAPDAELGHALARAVLTIWDGEAREAGVALIKANITAPEPELLRSFLSEFVLTAIGDRVDDPPGSARLRAGLVATQIFGLIGMRYILGVAPIASMSIDELVAHVGPTLQHYLTGELPGTTGTDED